MSPLVYSSDSNRSGTCPGCGRQPHKCRCEKSNTSTGSSGPVRVFRERRTGGKWIVRIEGLDLDPTSAAKLARRLKKKLGTGGKVQGRTIQIQGDRREDVLRWLEKEGTAAKPAGG